MIAPQLPALVRPLVDRGYTVFAVMHGSQPKYTIPEVLQDMHRAVRYIRHRGEDYGIDPERIAITGGSAGGHLSLMLGTTGTQGDAHAKDPVERVSSRVQAVACFVPPTDFLNYGEAGVTVLESEILKDFRPPFAFREFDEQSRVFVPITDPPRVREILAQISPIEHISADDAATLIVHGEKDTLVPVEQAERFTARLREAGVPAKLVVKKGAGHGWPGQDKDVVTFADWFDEQLGPTTREAR
jgi:acetyl esterase/lipase